MLYSAIIPPTPGYHSRKVCYSLVLGIPLCYLYFEMEERIVVVIGGGAGGMMAAGRAAESGARVLLLEKMQQTGRKVLVSGKTRCNLTNAAELDDFILAYGRNGRFLYSAFRRFFREDLLALMKRYGVETRTERGGRIFPVSGDARDVVRALEHYLEDTRVEVRRQVRVTDILADKGQVAGVRSEKADYNIFIAD